MDIEIDPTEAGFAPERLARIDRYLERFVDEGRLPGWQLVLTRRGKVVHDSSYGYRDLEARTPTGHDSLFRIMSMTKPIVSVAAMTLWEEGAFQLSTPVSDFIPSFADVRVYQGGSDLRPNTVAAVEPIRMVHLLTHTSGLTYPFLRQHPVDAMYRERKLDTTVPTAIDLEGLCDELAALPLLFQPGAEWAYSMATDVLGRVIEVISGKSLGEFLAERIFRPLGMTETRFGRATDPEPHLVNLYAHTPDGLTRSDLFANGCDKASFESGGGGLISSAHDYHRFTQMMLRRGELDGQRVIGSRTASFITTNHLPGGVDLDTYGRPLYSESPMRGSGFGLGFSVNLDPATAGRPGTPGSFGWGGMAGTRFWVDPVEELTMLFFTQVFSSTPLPMRETMPQLVYQALVD
ncbi:serine hydrolase domain-containing protein [Nocardioides sp. NPDC101246]|uniref:serine hydrolase domain-containing protein n=1 Tax=Nocardioides sp. NPDC101246 TaxID=3364336 RepID=UPI0037FE2272